MPDLQSYVPPDPEQRLLWLESRVERLEKGVKFLTVAGVSMVGFIVLGWMLSEFVIWRMG